MIRNKNFELVCIADDHMAVPVGDEAADFHGVVALNEAAAFLLNKLDQSRSEKELVELLQEEYDVDSSVAEKDVHDILAKFIDMQLVIND